MSEHQHSRTGHTKNAGAGNAEKDVAHVHHARITKHPIEPLLSNCNQPYVNDVPEQQHHQQIRPVTRAFWEQGNSHPQKTVQAKFLQHSGMQHRCWRWSRSVSFRRPGMKWEEGNENSKTDKQQQVHVSLCVRCDLTLCGTNL